MNLELEIEKGGQSNKLAEGLKESTANLGKEMLENAGIGIGEVVASTGINIGVGSTDDIIADNISAIVNLTGEQGLASLASNLNGYTQQLTEMGLNAPDELVNIVLEEITKVLAENGVIDVIKTGMQVTQGTVELAKGGLTYATSIATIVGNIQKLLLVLNKMQNVDVMCTPTVKDSLNALSASLINQLKAQYEALKQQLIIFYNSMICTSNDAVLDNIVVSANNILEVIEPALDPLMQKYTGHTLQEVRNICNQGFAYVGMIQRAAAKKRKETEDEEQQEAVGGTSEVSNLGEGLKAQATDMANNAKEQATEMVNQTKDTFKQIGTTVAEDAKNLSKEAKEKLKKELVEKSKEKWKEKTKDLNKEAAKEKLMEWLSQQPIMIQNAFHMLVIKDTIEDIKRFISQMQNTSIENQMDLLNTINNILEIFEQLGLTPDAKGITFDDLKALGMAVAGTAVQTATNIGDQVQNVAQQYTDQLIGQANAEISAAGGIVLSQNILEDAKGTVAGVADTAFSVAESNPLASSKEFASNTAAAVGQTVITSGVDQTINTAIDANLNTNLVGKISSIANENETNQATNMGSFTYTQSNENKNIFINVTILKNPYENSQEIISFIKSFKSGNKNIFNNGATKQIKDAFIEAWDTNDIIELKLQAIVDGVTKFYTFTISVNQATRNGLESVENAQESIQNTQESIQNTQQSSIQTQPQISSWNKSGLSDGGLNFICQYETGKKYGYTIQAKELNGYDLGDAGGHLTYGYGLLNHPTLNKKMDDVKKTWTQSELEELYIITVSKMSTKVDNWAVKNGLSLTQNQKDALVSACYNFGAGFLTLSGKVYSNTVNAIKQNPNNPMIKNLWEHISDIQGQKYPGLIRRRKAEADWYFNGGEGSSNSMAVSSSSSSIIANNNSSSVVGAISTGGGNTQTGSTEGLLVGKSVYLNSTKTTSITSNSSTATNEQGNVQVDENGNLIGEDLNGNPITSNFGEDTMSGITNKVTDISQITKNNSALSQLTKVNININADMIESVLIDQETGKMKILMFDEVIQFLKVLQPVIEVLKVLAHILENYMINKEFVRTKQHADLARALKNAAQLVNGLKDLIDLKNTNFFTIRTEEMANWALKEFNAQPDESGFMVINILQTTVLNTYCAIHAINPDYPLNLLMGTTLYFDGWAIENGGFEDGTSNGLDNIEINRYLGEVYYDKHNRSTISSEILRAKKRGVDPKYTKTPDEMLKNDSNDINSLLKSITFSSDEIEGQQTLSIGDLDLCSPTVKDRKKQEEPNKNAVIIEFGDEYTRGNRVEYSLAVKPGQSLKEGDIIGYIKNDKELTPIRTQYTGTIRSTDDSDSNFSHIYPSAATRHIIIDNPQKCSATDYNINDIMSLQQNFKKATELEALIINCMPLSILPSLLVNADRTSQMSTSYTSYNEIIKNYDSSINEFANILKHSSENFKSNTQTSTTKPAIEKCNGKDVTNISLQSVDKIKEDMLNTRKLMVEKAISVFNNAIDTNITKVHGDNMYLDCVGLAYSDITTFERSNNDGDTLEYNNYYINLLKSIPPSSKQQTQVINVNMSDIQGEIDKMHLPDASISAGYHVNMDSSIFSASNLISSLNNTKIGEDEGENKTDEFKRIINDIIDIRLAYEHQTNISMINVFNTYYRKNIKELNDPYNELNKRLEQEGIDKNDSDSILKQIKLDKNYIDATFNNTDNKQDFDNEKNEVCQQALTLFMYLINANITKSKSTKTYNSLTLLNAIKGTEELYINDIKKIIYNDKEYTDFGSLYDDIYSKEVEKDSNNEISDYQKRNNTINNVISLLKEKTPNINRTIVEYLVNAHLYGSENLSDESKQFFEDAAQNNLYYQMLKDESRKLEDFWKSVIDEYRTVNNLDNAIDAISNYANKMNSNAKWPQSIQLKVENTDYELYTFIDPFKTPKELPNDIPYVEMDVNNIPDAAIDLNDTKDIRENDPITIFDYEYWVVYMLNATLFTLIPMYWADGFDIPPFMTPLLLPAIYFPIAPPVMIPIVNVLMVFGIALRGMWPAPIIIMINLSSDDIDVMIFVKIALEIAKDVFRQTQSLVENTIPTIVNEMLMGYLDENEIAQKAIEKFRTYSSIISAIPIENKALIEKQFNEALVNELNKQSEANIKLLQAQDTINNANAEAQYNANKKINEFPNKVMKKFDRRQVITREADLGDGPEPM